MLSFVWHKGKKNKNNKLIVFLLLSTRDGPLSVAFQKLLFLVCRSALW